MCNGVMVAQLLNAGKVFEAMVTMTKTPLAHMTVEYTTNKTLLMHASELGCSAIVAKLVDLGADVTHLDVHGRSAEDYARAAGKQHCVELLAAKTYKN